MTAPPKTRMREPELRASAQTPLQAPAVSVAPLPAGSPVGSFVLRGVHRADEFAVCYRAGSSASDSEVVIEEYLPRAIARREADGTLGPRTPADAALWDEGLQGFLQESEQLSKLDHPALLRIGPVWQTRGTAYRLRMGGEGRPLAELVAAMTEPPAEPWLRRLLDPLLGALQAMHEAGWVHGNVRPAQIAMRADGSPVLLDSGAVRTLLGERLPQAVGDDAEAGFLPPELLDATLDLPVGPWSDLHALAQVLRYCITGQMPLPSDPEARLADADARPSLGPRSLSARYAPGLVAALERSLALEPRQRPQSVADFRHAVDAPVMLRAVPPSAEVRLAPVSSEERADVVAAARGGTPPPRARPAPPPEPRSAPMPFPLEAARERAAVPRGHAAVAREHAPVPREHAAAPREPAWAAAPDFGQPEQAQVFHFQVPGDEGRRVQAALPVRSVGPSRPSRRWPWALGGMLSGAALTGAAVFFWMYPGAELHFAIGPPSAGPAAVSAPPATGTAPAAAPGGLPLPGLPLPPRAGDATAPAAAAAPAAPTAAAPTTAVPAAAAPGTVAPNAGVPATAAPAAAPATAAPPANANVPARAISEVREAAPQGGGQAPAGAEASGGGDAAPPAESDGGETAGLPATPAAACAPRTNFSLYRCMQTQCERSQYYTHPQCIRLRVRDELP